jgi:hypothetical protein
MKAKLISITAALFFIILVVACEKDSAGPKITFKLKSLNATTFSPGETVKFTFEFIPKTTKKDTLFVARKFYTCSGTPPDTLINPFPEFDNTIKGELIFSFQYNSGGFYNGCRIGTTAKTDSLNYKFWIKDADGNVSDTITSPKIILLK